MRVIDPWVNTNMMGGGPPPKWLLKVKDDYFLYANAERLFF